MKYKKIPVRLFMPIGLLMVVASTFINSHFFTIPDFVLGAMIGAGIGLELTGFILLRKNGLPVCGCRQARQQ